MYEGGSGRCSVKILLVIFFFVFLSHNNTEMLSKTRNNSLTTSLPCKRVFWHGLLTTNTLFPWNQMYTFDLMFSSQKGPKTWDCNIIKCTCKYNFKEPIFKVAGIISRWVKNKSEYLEKNETYHRLKSEFLPRHYLDNFFFDF